MRSGISTSKSGLNTGKVKLSHLVAKYLSESQLAYALILVLAATRPLTRREMLQVAVLVGERLDVSRLKSWLYYQVVRGYLSHVLHGVYTIGPVVEPDLDEAKKLLQELGIDPDKISRLLLAKTVQDLVKLLEEEQELLKQLLDPTARNLVKKILNSINKPGKTKILYLAICDDGSTRFVDSEKLRKLGDKIRLRGIPCKIVAVLAMLEEALKS